jgi:hypothetical protein
MVDHGLKPGLSVSMLLSVCETPSPSVFKKFLDKQEGQANQGWQGLIPCSGSTESVAGERLHCMGIWKLYRGWHP